MAFLRDLIHRITNRRNSNPDPTEFLPRLPSNEAVLRSAVKSARKFQRATKNFELPFEPLVVLGPLVLDEKEKLWCARALEESGLSEDDYPKENWDLIVDAYGVTPGLYAAAEARLREGDHAGALGSWWKWSRRRGTMGLPGRPVDYIRKEEWLLVVMIYVGMGLSDSAHRALAWATAAADADQQPQGTSPSFATYAKLAWETRFDEVRKAVDSLPT